jgi:hypothetical protein
MQREIGPGKRILAIFCHIGMPNGDYPKIFNLIVVFPNSFIILHVMLIILMLTITIIK